MKTYKTHTEYNYWFYNIIKQFTEDKRTDILMYGLNMMEEQIREDNGYSKEQTLWFRLFDDDTGANDAQSIVSDYNSTKENREYLLENLWQCLTNASVKLYFS